ncbi:RagB/SusD family nutrient uptake outer membrane protein [Pontibacter ruber]|uniref:RagB/SusD family nutrient uptake outer membrane protein n=1 Tax=Pontibacter ruber TaxID=1343895 RepID=A0ABW5CUY9_9BACT|nr:RagB/SusD family nutrient uptake outer membrane protein [Pontibacter ruber]
MINRRYFKVLALGLLLSTSACEVLDVEPQASLPADSAYNTRTGVEAGLIGAYSALQSANYMGLRYFVFADLATANVAHTGTFPSFAQIEQNSILADNVEISNMWNAIYDGVNRVNTLISVIPNISDPAFNNNAALGEARFLRAYHYFNLINYFGGSGTGYGENGVGVPLKLTPTLTAADAEPLARASEAEVIAQVYQDLDFAIENLNGGNKGRASKAAALALKSRVALYQKDYQLAADLAKQVIELGKYSLAANYGDIYALKNTSEAIWELQFDPVNSNSIAFFWFPTSLGGRNEVSPDASLAGAHEATDKRLPVNVNGSYTQKYTKIAGGDDNVLLIRYAEVLLNRAEALARLGGAANELEALDLVNRVRARAGLTPLVATGQDLINAILKERRIELAHEGHYWFDLRRTNTTGLADANKNLWPIPQREVLTSGGVITQNTGY